MAPPAPPVRPGQRPDAVAPDVVRAAGAVPVRDGPHGPEILFVHRPGHGDWSLPKGKLDDHEPWEEAAVRELAEETGARVRLGPELPPTTYRDRAGRPKHVRWWQAVVLAEHPRAADDEVDEVRWVAVSDVRELATYASDVDLVDRALQPDEPSRTVLLHRHAHAGDRQRWDGDDRLRPVSERGRAQARALEGQLDPWHVRRVVTSPYVRCRQSVEPLGAARDVAIEEEERLAEGADPATTSSLLRTVGSGTVLCSHGDVIGDLLAGLADGSGHLDGYPLRAQKGSTWVLTLHDGGLTAARYLPPVA